MRARFFGIVTSLASLAVPRFADAACPEAMKARSADERGERALESLDVERAVKSFTETNDVCPNPQTRLAIANARLLGKKDALATSALDQYVTEASIYTLVFAQRRIPMDDAAIRALPRLREVGLRRASIRHPDDRVVSASAGILPYYWRATR